ncbi:MAG: pirin family protein [Planctomycetota bacterium]|nr:MAG: pirin family protein [Planctomycetota bacterium]
MTATSRAPKALTGFRTSEDFHWVGDGFPVRTLFAYDELGAELSPFLLLDHAGPTTFAPTTQRLGVGPHPHRGFETVTIVYEGEVEHRDSAGAGGTIGPGDVQWMTAASGLVHEEFHGREFAKRGGAFEMAQLWVNLPARAKMSTPRYQGITSARIPRVALAGGRAEARVIAGELDGAKGPAETVTPMHVWDVRMSAGAEHAFQLPEGFTSALVVLRGSVRANDSEPLRRDTLALFERAGTELRIVAAEDACVLLLCGEPIEEPIVGQGPFVMNTGPEIHQAIVDYQNGKMGRL